MVPMASKVKWIVLITTTTLFFSSMHPFLVSACSPGVCEGFLQASNHKATIFQRSKSKKFAIRGSNWESVNLHPRPIPIERFLSRAFLGLSCLKASIFKDLIRGFNGKVMKVQIFREALHGEVHSPGILPSFRRQLLGHKHKGTVGTRHDLFTPSTNPVTNSPMFSAPGDITVPSTNPVTTIPVNPSIPAGTVPSTNPFGVPTNPVTPIIIPGTTPTTNPVTTPATTYPFMPPAGYPGSLVPGTVPFSPAGSGQIWCIAKTGVPDSALQMAIDYACGYGADCSAIQQTGSCYIPNTLHDHASYSFNSYYQKNPTPSSCDFGGAAMLVNENPSLTTCVYPSSSLSAPGFTTNSSPSGSSTTVFGSNIPLSTNSPTISGGSSSSTSTSNSFCLTKSTSLIFAIVLNFLIIKL